MSARQPQGTFRALSPQALIASLEAEAYGTWQQAFAEVYGR